MTNLKQFNPKRGMLLVRRDPKAEEKGGIIIPEAYRLHGWRATVVKAGTDSGTIREGDAILFLKEYTVLPFPEREMAITSAEHVLAKIMLDGLVERLCPLNRFVMVREHQENEGVIKIARKPNAIRSGEVVRVAPGCKDVSTGLVVMYEKTTAACVEEGLDFKMVAEEDVVCVQTNT